MTEATARIPLRNRKGEVVAHALIDADDEAALLALGRWHRSSGGYAVHGQRIGPRNANRTVMVRMHRIILGLDPADPRQGDHINRDRLDNRRANLRIVSARENSQNVSSLPGSSRFRGVCWDQVRGGWLAQARMSGVLHRLGVFATEEEAAQVAAAWRAEHMAGSVD